MMTFMTFPTEWQVINLMFQTFPNHQAVVFGVIQPVSGIFKLAIAVLSINGGDHGTFGSGTMDASLEAMDMNAQRQP